MLTSMDNLDLITELKAYLEIDKHSLDDELVRQPALFFKVADAYVEAVAERDSCKEELAAVDAELDPKIRGRFEQMGDKYTEAMVKAEIQLAKKHQDAFDTFNLAKARADRLLALKEAFQQRNYMLKELASLYVSNYYDKTSVQGTSSTDKAAYDRRRERLAEGRRASR